MLYSNSKLAIKKMTTIENIADEEKKTRDQLTMKEDKKLKKTHS